MELQPGAVAVIHRTFTQADFDRFAALSGDDNPIHVDPAFAARTRFGRTVCHGMLLYSVIGAALTCAVGRGWAPHEQELMFVTPTYTGENIEVRLEITGLSPDGASATLSTVITRPDGLVACEGTALIGLPGAPAVRPAAHRGREAPAMQDDVATHHKGLRLGQSAEVEKEFSPADLAEYVALSGDSNTSHLAAGAQAPPGLLGGLFSDLLGTQLPGRGTNWLKQRLVFPHRAPIGRPIRARVEIVRLRPEKDLVNLATTCTLRDGRVVCHGEALVLVKDLEER